MPQGRDDEAQLTADIVELARQYGRYGYRKIAELLRRAGWLANDKRVERIWRRRQWQERGPSPIQSRTTSSVLISRFKCAYRARIVSPIGRGQTPLLAAPTGIKRQGIANWLCFARLLSFSVTTFCALFRCITRCVFLWNANAIPGVKAPPLPGHFATVANIDDFLDIRGPGQTPDHTPAGSVELLRSQAARCDWAGLLVLRSRPARRRGATLPGAHSDRAVRA